MRRAILGVVGLTLTACGAQVVQHYDIAKIEADFKACMDATSAPQTARSFRRKINACEEAAWASAGLLR